MNNNEVFKTVLHLTGCSQNKELLQKLFSLGGVEPSQSQIRAWRCDVDHPRASKMPDAALRAFFAGLFAYRDLKRAEGVDIFIFPRDGDKKERRSECK